VRHQFAAVAITILFLTLLTLPVCSARCSIARRFSQRAQCFFEARLIESQSDDRPIMLACDARDGLLSRSGKCRNLALFVSVFPRYSLLVIIPKLRIVFSVSSTR
jgi:hypothetical protein